MDAQRLDVHNGLLLSARWDAAFDRGLISFADDGAVLASPRLTETARVTLGVTIAPHPSGDCVTRTNPTWRSTGPATAFADGVPVQGLLDHLSRAEETQAP